MTKPTPEERMRKQLAKMPDALVISEYKRRIAAAGWVKRRQAAQVQPGNPENFEQPALESFEPETIRTCECGRQWPAYLGWDHCPGCSREVSHSVGS